MAMQKWTLPRHTVRRLSQSLRGIQVSVVRTRRGAQWGGDHRLHGQTTSTWPVRLQLIFDTLGRPAAGTACDLTAGETNRTVQ